VIEEHFLELQTFSLSFLFSLAAPAAFLNFVHPK